jgi:hypothetical protein
MQLPTSSKTCGNLSIKPTRFDSIEQMQKSVYNMQSVKP